MTWFTWSTVIDYLHRIFFLPFFRRRQWRRLFIGIAVAHLPLPVRLLSCLLRKIVWKMCCGNGKKKWKFFVCSFFSCSLSWVTPVTHAFSACQRWENCAIIAVNSEINAQAHQRLVLKYYVFIFWCVVIRAKIHAAQSFRFFLLRPHSLCAPVPSSSVEQLPIGRCCCCWPFVSVAVMRNRKCIKRATDRKHTVHEHQHYHASQQLDENHSRHSLPKQSCSRYPVHFYEIWYMNSQVAATRPPDRHHRHQE